MIRPVIITADSACDLPAALSEKYQIQIIHFMIIEGEQSFQDGIEFQPDGIYTHYREQNLLPTTVAIGPVEYGEFFKKFTKRGFAVVHISISSDMTSTYRNACVAASELEDVYIVDSRHVSTGEALAAIEGCKLRDAGLEAREIAVGLQDFTQKIQTSFVLDTLEYMWKGGRCTGVTAMGANLLNLKPCLEMRGGSLRVGRKYRGPIQRVYLQYIRDRLSCEKIREDLCFITHSSELSGDEIDALKGLVLEHVPFKEIHVTRTGCAVTSHCGPGTLGVLFAQE